MLPVEPVRQLQDTVSDETLGLTTSRLVAAKLGERVIYDNPETGLREHWNGGAIYLTHNRATCFLNGYPFGMYDPPVFL